MSFFSKIVENKGVTLAVVGGALAIGFAILYKGYKDQDKQESQEQNDKYDEKKEIQALKSQINVSNPSLDDVKQVLRFSMDVAKRRIATYSKQFKAKRQQFNSSDRKNKTTDYMNVIVNGMDEVRNLAVVTQSQIMKELGLSQAVFMKYQNQLGMFMQELMMSQGRSLNSEKKITLQEVKYAIRLQIQYLRNEGQEMIDRVLLATKSWPPAKKRQLPLLFSVVIADGAFQDHPEIDEEAIQAAEVQMQNYLMAQMNELHQVMAPMLTKLSKQIGGMGGMGGMGMGMGMEEDMFAGGFSQQQMQQMQQLQQLRMSDPAAFEQLMRNFHG